MKKIILGLLLLGCFKGNAQQDKILFSYDTAGNQIKRQLCIGCSPTAGKVIQDVTNLKEEDLQKFFPEDDISYYPNPVKEQLYLKWDLKDGKKVTSMQLYSLSGQLLKSVEKLDSLNNHTLMFQDYPQGIYSLILQYNNSEQKSIKIVKE